MSSHSEAPPKQKTWPLMLSPQLKRIGETTIHKRTKNVHNFYFVTNHSFICNTLSLDLKPEIAFFTVIKRVPYYVNYECVTPLHKNRIDCSFTQNDTKRGVRKCQKLMKSPKSTKWEWHHFINTFCKKWVVKGNLSKKINVTPFPSFNKFMKNCHSIYYKMKTNLSIPSYWKYFVVFGQVGPASMIWWLYISTTVLLSSI